MDWKRLLTNIAGVTVGVGGIIHALPPSVTASAHVPEVLAVIAAVIGLLQRPPQGPS